MSQLPPEAIALASRMFNAARTGDSESEALLSEALQRGLPPNMTNEKGDTLVSHVFCSNTPLQEGSLLLHSHMMGSAFVTDRYRGQG